MNRVLISLAICLAFGFMPLRADIIHIPGDYSTIQEGIDAAYEHDTVLVKPGEYVENIDFIGKNIVVASLFLTSGDPAFIESTIIDGDSAGSVITFQNHEDSTAAIIGFTIQHGRNDDGSGILCSDSDPAIRFNWIRENRILYRYGSEGGGICCINSNAIIEYNTIEYNQACFGAGIYTCDSATVIRNNIIRRNDADP